MDAVAKLRILFEADASALEKSLEEQGKKAEGLGTKLGGMGKAAAVGGVAAVGGIAAIGGAILAVGNDFDDAGDTMRAATGKTGKELDALNASMRNVGTGVPESIGEVSSVMAELASRTGQTGPELEALTKQTLALARVTGGDAQASVEGLTRMLGDASIPVEEQAFALDNLFKTSQQTGVGMDRLSGLMVAFGAPMRNLGMSFEESAALLGRFEKEGVNTELVMGALKAASAKWAAEGLAPAEGLKQTIAKIQELGPSAEATALAMETFGQKAGGDMVDTILGGKFAIDDLVESIADSGESIQRAADATAGPAEKFGIFKNKVMSALEPAGTALIDGLMAAFEKLEPHLPAITEGISKFVGFLTENPAIAATVAVIATLAGVFGTIMAVVGPFIPIIMSVVGAFGSLGAIVGTIAALFNPVTIAIGLVIAIIAGLKLAWDSNLGGIQEKTAAAVEFVRALWDTFVAKLKMVIIEVILFVAGIIAKWEEIRSNIATKLGEIGTAITEKWNEFWSTINQKLEDIWSSIRLKWDAILKEIRDKLDAILGKVTEAWEDIRAKIDEAVETIKKALTEKWEQVRQIVFDALEKVKTVISDAWEKAKELVDQGLQKISDLIKAVIEGWKIIIEKALQIATWLWDVITGAAAKVGQAVGELGDKAIKAGIAAWETLVSATLDMGTWIWNAIQSVAKEGGALFANVKNIGAEIIAGIGAGIRGAFSFIETAISALAGLLPQWLKDWLGIHSPAKITQFAGEALAEGIGVGFQTAWEQKVLPIIGRAVKQLPAFIMASLDSAGGINITIGGAGGGGSGAIGRGGPGGGGSAATGRGGPGIGYDISELRGGAGRLKVRPMSAGRGGFVAASKSNWWQVWVQKFGIPEEASARKAADMLGIPIPDWLEEMFGGVGMKGGADAKIGKATFPMGGPGGIDRTESLSHGFENLSVAVTATTEALKRLYPVIPPGGTLPVIPPDVDPGSGHIGGPGTGRIGGPIIGPPGGGSRPLTVEAGEVIVPSLTVPVETAIRVVVQIGERTIEELATIIDKRLATRAAVGVP